MATLAQLTAKRAKLRAEMLALQKRADEADPDNGTMPDDMQAIFDDLKQKLEELEAAINNRAALDAFERAEPGRPVVSADQRWISAKRAFRPGIAIAAAAGLMVDAGPEREVQQEMQRRSRGRSAINGAALIPFEAFHKPVERRVLTPAGAGFGLEGVHLDAGLYIDALRAALIVPKLGARYINLDMNTDMPRLATTATAQWVLDGNSAATDTTESFDKVSLRAGRHVIGICEFTREMLLTSTPAVQDAVRDDLVQVLARAIDLAALAGTGNNDPLGVLNTPGLTIQSLGTNGGPITWAAVLALLESVELANAPEASIGFAGNPRIRASMMNTLRFPGINGSVPLMEKPDELAGYTYASTTQLPSNSKGSGSNLSTLICGAWSELVVAMFGDGISVLANPYGPNQYASGNIQLRAICTADVAVRHISAFAALTDVAAS